MYSVSNDFLESISSNDREYKITGTITTKKGAVIPFSDSTIQSGSFRIDKQCVNGEELDLGSVYASELKFTIESDVDRYSLYEAQVTAKFHLKLASGDWEPMPLGVYAITEAIHVQRYITITALDNMVMLDKAVKKRVSGTAYDLLQLIQTDTGVSLAQSRTEIEALPNGKYAFVGPSDAGAVGSYRDLLSDISALLGCFAVIDRAGKIALTQFKAIPAAEINEHQRYSSDIADFKANYRAVGATVKGDKIIADSKGEGLTLFLPDNVLLAQVGDINKIGDLLWNIQKQVKTLDYTPCKIEYIGNPALDLGDMIRIRGGSMKAEYVDCIITGNTFSYRGSQALTSVGKNPRLKSVKTKTDRDIQTALGNSGANSPDVVVYENTSGYNIAKSEKRIIRIIYGTSIGSIPLFAANIVLEMATSGTVKFSYLHNSNLIEYNPQALLPEGMHTVALYLPITTGVVDGENIFDVRINSADGTGKIAPLDILASVSGSGVSTSPGTGGKEYYPSPPSDADTPEKNIWEKAVCDTGYYTQDAYYLVQSNGVAGIVVVSDYYKGGGYHTKENVRTLFRYNLEEKQFTIYCKLINDEASTAKNWGVLLQSPTSNGNLIVGLYNRWTMTLPLSFPVFIEGNKETGSFTMESPGGFLNGYPPAINREWSSKDVLAVAKKCAIFTPANGYEKPKTGILCYDETAPRKYKEDPRQWSQWWLEIYNVPFQFPEIHYLPYNNNQWSITSSAYNEERNVIYVTFKLYDVEEKEYKYILTYTETCFGFWFVGYADFVYRINGVNFCRNDEMWYTFRDDGDPHLETPIESSIVVPPAFHVNGKYIYPTLDKFYVSEDLVTLNAYPSNGRGIFEPGAPESNPYFSDFAYDEKNHLMLYAKGKTAQYCVREF